MLSVMCPNCKETLRVPERFAGTAGACKKCGCRIVIPPMAIHVPGGDPSGPAAPRTESKEDARPARGFVAPAAGRNPRKAAPAVPPAPLKEEKQPSLLSYIVASTLLLAFFVVVYFYGVFPRAGNLSKALNMGLPVIGLVLLVVLAVLIGSWVKRIVHAKDGTGAGTVAHGTWLIWGGKDELECPYCGAPADLDLLVDLSGDVGIPGLSADPRRTRRYTCGDCGAQFPFRPAAGGASARTAGSERGAIVYEWQPQRMRPAQ